MSLDPLRGVLMKQELYRDDWSVDTMNYLTRRLIMFEKVRQVSVVDSLLLSIVVDTPDTNPAVAAQIKVLRKECTPPTLSLILFPLHNNAEQSLVIYLPHYRQWVHFTTGKKHHLFLARMQARLDALAIIGMTESNSLLIDCATQSCHIIFYILIVIKNFDTLLAEGCRTFLSRVTQQITVLNERNKKSFLLRLEALV